MSMSIAPNETRTLLQQNPRLSDDSEVDKNSSQPSPPVKPVIVAHGGATGVKTVVKSK
jgi:hypothetical protein